MKALVNIIATALTAAATLLSCSTPQQHRPTIAVSIAPQKYLLERIAGDRYDVVSLLSQGTNPETFEPNASHLLSLETADAYFLIGNIDFELALSNRLKANNSDLKVFDTSAGITLLEGTHDCGHHAHGDDSDHHHSHDIDPHVWSSARNARIISTNMLNALMALDPKNHDYYLANYRALTDSLDTLDHRLDSILAPVRGKAFAVWHPSLSYLARDYDLKQLTLQTANKEESIKGFRAKLDAIDTDSVKLFLYQPEFDSRQAQALAQQLSLTPVMINPLNPEWSQELLHTATAIAKAYE